MSNGYIYLASPYNHANESVRESRYQGVLKVTAGLLRDGYFVYSPIVHCHQIKLLYGLPAGWEYWSKFDEAMIGGASELWVLTLDGWNESVGVKAEIEIAQRIGIPVRFVEAQ